MSEILRLDPEMHRRIAEALSFLEYFEWMIDPLMFRVDPERVRALQRLFRAEMTGEPLEPPAEVAVTFDDINTLIYYVMAAHEYSLRTDGRGKLPVSDAQMRELHEWLVVAEDRLRDGEIRRRAGEG
jgi:hypothetical protein